MESTSSDEDIRKLRIEKAAELRGTGREPYAYSFARSHTAGELQALHADLPSGESRPEARVSVAGRVLARRVMGKLAFCKLADASGSIQLYVDRKVLDGEEAEGSGSEADADSHAAAADPSGAAAAAAGGSLSFGELKNLVDTGDIVGATGSMKRTEKGELSVVVDGLHVLTKSLLPLPDKWHGLADVEARYRKRYLDMIVTPGVLDTFRARSLVISTMRRQLEGLGFLEVETPVLEAAAGGADARPFVTYHNALGRDFTLRIATELHLKRLVVSGGEQAGRGSWWWSWWWWLGSGPEGGELEPNP